jgi:glycosyltransferase involved in cell wall biosynthesis
VNELAGAGADDGAETEPSVIVFQPTFPRTSLLDLPKPKSFDARPFRILFAGRVEENKGALDLVPIAKQLHAIAGGEFVLDVCGTGTAFLLLQRRVRECRLDQVVKVHGRLNRHELLERYLDAHVVIVPTRTSFEEGFAMVVAEAIPLLRPVVTCSVVPAAEVLRAAVVLAKPDDMQSYVDAILKISRSANLYSRLVEEAARLRPAILDNSASLLQALCSLNRLGMMTGAPR